MEEECDEGGCQEKGERRWGSKKTIGSVLEQLFFRVFYEPVDESKRRASDGHPTEPTNTKKEMGEIDKKNWERKNHSTKPKNEKNLTIVERKLLL